jgi:hypothetical protein
MRRTILRHRDVVEISIGRIPMGPNALRLSEGVIGILRAGGVPDELAVQSFLLLISAVNGFTMDETGYDQDAPPSAPPDDQAPEMVRDYLETLPPEEFPNMTEVAGAFAMGDQDERFALLIDLFVEGLARRADEQRS